MFVMCRYLTVVRRYYGDVIIYLELFCRSNIAVIARLCFSWRHTFFRKPVGIILSELLWSPYVIGQTIIFSSYFFLFLSFFSSPSLSGRTLNVYHTLAHGVALVRI